MKRAILLIIFLLLFFSILSHGMPVYAKSAHDSPVDILPYCEYQWGDTLLNEEDWSDYHKPLTGQRQRSIWLRVRLPDRLWNDPVLFARFFQQSFEVYYQNKIIYSYGRMDTSNTKSAPGSKYHFIPLPSDFRGEMVYFRVYSPFLDYAGQVSEMAVGSGNELLLDVIKENIDHIILSCFIFITGIVMISIHFFLGKRYIEFFSIGFSSACLGLWILAESRIVVLLIDKPLFFMYLAYLSIFLMPTGFCAVIGELCETKHRVLFKRIWQVYICFTALAFILEITRSVSLFNTVKLFHVMLVATMAISVLAIIKAAFRGNRDAAMLIPGIIILCLAGIHDILAIFYISFSKLVERRYTHWGMFLVVLSLVFILGRRFAELYDKLESDSKENETNFRALFDNMIDGFVYGRVLVDDNKNPLDLVLIEANKAFEEQAGVRREELIGNRFLEMKPGGRAPEAFWLDDLARVALSDEKVKYNKYYQFRKRWYDVSAYSPKKGYFSMIVSDVTERKETEEIIRKQAYHDRVTGIYNRTYFEEQMAMLDKDLSVKKPVSIISVDIDGLKLINDTFGHKLGDELLVQGAKIISKAFRKTDIVARVGGDEFCVIIPNSDSSTVIQKREKIVELVDKYNRSNPSVPISMSIGAATYDELLDNDIYSVYKRADDNMYKYKLSQSGSFQSKLIDILLIALSERDYVAQGHVERLAGLSELMADTLRLPDIERRNLILLSKVHDLGKIGIPDEILFKPAKLDREEFEKMKEHVNIGYSIANRSKELSGVAQLILSHHEFWNGEGYPNRLKGEEIPLECRILSIIDAFDAMTSKRPYSNGISIPEALQELERNKGTQFDPYITEKFIGIIKEQSWGY